MKRIVTPADKIAEIMGVSLRVAGYLANECAVYYDRGKQDSHIPQRVSIAVETLGVAGLINRFTFDPTSVYFHMEDADTIDEFIEELRKLKD